MHPLDPYLTSDEEVVVRTRLHPVVFGNATLFAAFAVGVVLLVIARNDLAASTVRLLWLGAAALIAVSFLTPLLRWRASEFAVTNRRVLAGVGLMRTQVVEVSLTRGTAVQIEQGVWGRLFGYGTLRLSTRDGAEEAFPQVGRPAELRQAVSRLAPPSSAARRR